MAEQISSWPFRVDEVANYAWIDNVFSSGEIRQIIELGKEQNLKEAKIGGESDESGDLDNSTRDSKISWIKPGENSSWLFAKMTDLIGSMNNQYFNFDLSGLVEGFQFTEYNSPAGHYDYHMDRMSGVKIRKLSLTMQLSDPEDYEGGDLEFLCGGKPESASREKGAITFFPSWVMHRVTPVTKGTRYSLVAWITGPNFK